MKESGAGAVGGSLKAETTMSTGCPPVGAFGSAERLAPVAALLRSVCSVPYRHQVIVSWPWRLLQRQVENEMGQ